MTNKRCTSPVRPDKQFNASTEAVALSESRTAIEEARVLVAGVARNCGRSLPATVSALERATTGFKSREFLIIESDSTDDTVEKLAALEARGRIAYWSLGNLKAQFSLRTERIAHCRNQIVAHVRNREVQDLDFVILADLDGVNSNVTRDAIEDGWRRDEPWDVLTANQREFYYDIWALRHHYWSPVDCWEAARELEPLFGRRTARRLAVTSKQVRIQAGAGLIEVESAFGGLGIYTAEAYSAGTYTGTKGDGEELCEHVPFHAELRARGFRIYINPALLNTTQIEHRVGPAGRLLRRTRSVLRLNNRG
jgi:hypothetical protein